MMIKIYWMRFHGKYLEKNKLRFISWFNEKYPGKYCWADCVSWAFSPFRVNPFKLETSKGCEIESKEHDCKLCYCGEWQEGKCFVLLTKKEQQIIEDRYKNAPVTELPF